MRVKTFASAYAHIFILQYMCVYMTHTVFKNKAVFLGEAQMQYKYISLKVYSALYQFVGAVMVSQKDGDGGSWCC